MSSIFHEIWPSSLQQAKPAVCCGVVYSLQSNDNILFYGTLHSIISIELLLLSSLKQAYVQLY